MRIEAELESLGLALPAPMQVPAGLDLPFARVRVRGDRAGELRGGGGDRRLNR